MLVVEANTAIAPSTVLSVVFCSPASRIGADDGDRGDRVGQRHQRRVQQPRDAADDVQPEEGGQHQHEQAGNQNFGHVGGNSLRWATAAHAGRVYRRGARIVAWTDRKCQWPARAQAWHASAKPMRGSERSLADGPAGSPLAAMRLAGSGRTPGGGALDGAADGLEHVAARARLEQDVVPVGANRREAFVVRKSGADDHRQIRAGAGGTCDRDRCPSRRGASCRGAPCHSARDPRRSGRAPDARRSRPARRSARRSG